MAGAIANGGRVSPVSGVEAEEVSRLRLTFMTGVLSAAGGRATTGESRCTDASVGGECGLDDLAGLTCRRKAVGGEEGCDLGVGACRVKIFRLEGKKEAQHVRARDSERT